MKRCNLKKQFLVILLVFVQILCLCPSVLGAEKAVQKEFYISPEKGNDNNPGTKEAPFKTIERALSAVSCETKKQSGDIYVYFDEGRYELSSPIEFNKTHGGKGEYSVYYKAMEEKTPVISGGTQITGWELYDSEKNIYKASAKGLYSRHFVVDGALATRARSEGKLKDVKLDYGKNGLTCSNVEMLGWKNKTDIELIFNEAFHHRRILVDEIKKVDDKKIQICLPSKFWNYPISTTWTPPNWVENALELLDSEGEFYIDKKEDVIYYKPLEGKNIENSVAVIPCLEELFKVGGYDYYNKAENIVFEGLKFTELTWMKPTEDRGLYTVQDGYIYGDTGSTKLFAYTLCSPSAVTTERAKNIDFIECSFAAMGGSAVRVLEGSEKINIEGNHMYDLGSGALYIGSVRVADRKPKDARRTVKDITVNSNYIHHVAKENVASSGISAGFPTNLSIVHNEIHDVPYSGIHIGWDWGSVTEKTLLNFLCEYNYVHDFMKGEGMLDGGGIYTLGYTSATIENPNKIVRNYFKDCYSSSISAGGMIYLDNTSSNYLIEGNVLDNLEGSKVWDGSMFAQTSYTPLNDRWVNNYTTKVTQKSNNPTRNIVFENNHHHPAANWPKEAREVIKKSGLLEKYRYLSPRSDEYKRVFTDEFVNLNAGETHKLFPIAATEFCEEVNQENAVVTYMSQDESIATVTKDGVITAKTNGQTKIITTMTINGVTYTAPTTVSIGSGLAKVNLRTKTPNKMVKGETKTLPSLVGESFGNDEIELDAKKISYKSSDENIISVDSLNGTFTAKNYGTAKLMYTAEYDGVIKEGEHEISVIDYADNSYVINHPITTMEDILADTDSWLLQAGSMNPVTGGVGFEETSVAHYTSEKYQDVVFDFYMSLDKQATWPSITLRNQTLEGFSDLNSFYIIGFARNGIELQRFNGQNRTSIFCTLSPNTRIGTIHPMVLAAGRKYHVQIATLNETDGVRIIVNIDGKNIMNYLDEAEGRIEDEGYLGLMINGTTMNITTK